MARSAGTVVENNFSRGLITEATGLNFPENACTETYDCVFEQTGEVHRRLGHDIEEGSVVEPFDGSGAVREFVWKTVSNNGTISFLVQQLGATIFFYDLGTGLALSASQKNFTIDLTDYETISSPPTGNRYCSFAAGNNFLFIAHPQCDPLTVKYDPDLDDITVVVRQLQIRDIAGLDDGLAVDVRPTTLSAAHNYNLRNQGWYPAAVLSINIDNTGVANTQPITHWFNVIGNYPANNQIWWAYKRPRNDSPSRVYQEVFDPGTRSYIWLGNTPAPKGHFIVNAFNIDRSAVSGVGGIPTETTGGARPTAVAFYAGRVFWGGVQAPKFGSNIYFSQIIERDEQVAQCYQAQDPTDEDTPDLLPSDGGVITIPEIQRLVHIQPVGENLWLFATNGVWRISGSEGIGFRANDYSVTKVSETPCSSSLGLVLVEGTPVWWSETGIWTIQGQAGLEGVVSVSDRSIKKFFDDIPSNSKYFAKGAYNPLSRVVQWAYRSTDFDPSDTSEAYRYDRILNLNTLTGAFYPWTFPDTGTLVRGIFSSSGQATFEELNAVIVQPGDPVVTGPGGVDNVLSPTPITAAVQSAFWYVVQTPADHGVYDEGIVYGSTFRESLLDWTLLGENVSYSSYLLAGYRVYGDGDKDFQSNYVTVNYTPLPFGSAYVQGLWDYANNGNTGKWSSRQQIYKTSSGFTYRTNKIKIRGSGKALQLRITSFPGAPFEINGWSILVTGEQSA